MTTGISLTSDNTGIDDQSKLKQCFGDVKCLLCEHNVETICLLDGKKIKIENWHCQKAGQPVVDLEHCPLKYWLKMVVAVGTQNVFKTK